jgi:hypothetical protein
MTKEDDEPQVLELTGSYEEPAGILFMAQVISLIQLGASLVQLFQ